MTPADRALLESRVTVGRITEARWSECRVADDSAVVVRWHCVARDSAVAELRRDPARALRSVRDASRSADPRGQRIQAVAELRWRGDGVNAVERSRVILERTLASSGDDPTMLNDLAVVYSEIAEQEQSLTPLLRALDLLDRGLATNGDQRALLFNRAFVLQRLYFSALAEAAWSTYLAKERDPAWRKEATFHLRRLRESQDTLGPRDLLQRTRDGMFRMLGTWGRAIELGDTARAISILASLRASADSIKAAGGDATVPAVVDWVTAETPSRNTTLRLAAGVRDLAAGIAMHDSAQYEMSDVALQRANGTLTALGSPLVGWVRCYMAAVALNRGQYSKASDHLDWVFRHAPNSQPGLTARAWWLRGVIALRQGDYESANRAYLQARARFADGRDVKNQAAVAYLLSEGLALAGQTTGSLTEAFVALRGLSPFRDAIHRNNHLMRVAAVARGLGMRHAALDAVGEALSVDSARAKPDAIVLALCTRAQDLAAIGNLSAAFSDLDVARGVAARLSGHSDSIATASIDLTRGRLMRAQTPRAALPHLERAAAAYRHLGVSSFLKSSLYELAHATYDAGDRAKARASLVDALHLVEGQRGHFTSVAGRAAYLETTENIFDLLVDIDIDEHRYTEAFDDIERERHALWTSASSFERPSANREIERLRHVAEESTLVVAYAVLAQRLVIWYVSSDAFGARVISISRADVQRLTSRLADDLSSQNPSAMASRSRLFDVLLRPIGDVLRRSRRIAVIPDRELLNVPFAALWDASRSRYLVEDYRVRTLPSAAFITAAGQRHNISRPRSWSTVVVGNPKLGASLEADLPPLMGAQREAEAVAQTYLDSKTLIGERATRSAILTEIGRRDVLHFAGHAVFDPDQPERSYLALAPASGEGGTNLQAREIATMRLSNLELVVLSACRTLGLRPTRTGPVTGLAASFLRAGAHAAISTLWDVDDRSTMSLIVNLHDNLRRGTPADEALRQAQLAALHSTQIEDRSAAVWAAFVYTGY